MLRRHRTARRSALAHRQGATTGEMHVCTTRRDPQRQGHAGDHAEAPGVRDDPRRAEADSRSAPRSSSPSRWPSSVWSRPRSRPPPPSRPTPARSSPRPPSRPGLEVAGRDEETTSTSVTETFTIHPSKKRRLFVFYSGVDTFALPGATSGSATSAARRTTTASSSSFNEIRETGAVRCPHTRYKEGSIPYQVTLSAGLLTADGAPRSALARPHGQGAGSTASTSRTGTSSAYAVGRRRPGRAGGRLTART